MTKTDLIPAPVRAELTAESSSATDFVTACSAMVVASQTDLDFAGALLVDVAARRKAFDERRTKITKPILAAKREVDELFAPVLEPLKAAEAILRDKVAAYNIARDDQRRKAMTAGIVPDAPPENVKGISMRAVWDVEVVDLSAVPREYLTIDKKKCLCAKLDKGVDEIPGVRFVQLGLLMVRT